MLGNKASCRDLGSQGSMAGARDQNFWDYLLNFLTCSNQRSEISKLSSNILIIDSLV